MIPALCVPLLIYCRSYGSDCAFAFHIFIPLGPLIFHQGDQENQPQNGCSRCDPLLPGNDRERQRLMALLPWCAKCKDSYRARRHRAQKKGIGHFHPNLRILLRAISPHSVRVFAFRTPREGPVRAHVCGIWPRRRGGRGARRARRQRRGGRVARFVGRTVDGQAVACYALFAKHDQTQCMTQFDAWSKVIANHPSF